MTKPLVFSLQLLAVVFDTFNDIEKRKFKSLLLHKRTAIQHAYRLLITKQVQRAARRLRAACAAAGGEVSFWRKGIWMLAPTWSHGGSSVKWENLVLERMWSLISSCGWPGDFSAEHQRSWRHSSAASCCMNKWCADRTNSPTNNSLGGQSILEGSWFLV